MSDNQLSARFCPTCKLGNDSNATICRHCGAPLDPTTAKTGIGKDDLAYTVSGEYPGPSHGIALFPTGSPTPIAVTDEPEFILGRKVEGTSESLVDLTALDGFAMGVSRRHAMIRSSGGKYVITDLNSSNGTWLNGKILLATQPYELPSGAVIQLGRLRLIAIYNSPPGVEK